MSPDKEWKAKHGAAWPMRKSSSPVVDISATFAKPPPYAADAKTGDTIIAVSTPTQEGDAIKDKFLKGDS